MTYRDAYRGKIVLVTGGAGAIGSNLCRELACLGARIIILDDLSSGVRWNVPQSPQVVFVEGDILDETRLKCVFFERPQIVFHLAGFFANQNSVEHPERDLMINGMGTLRVLEYSLLSRVERFVFASSSSTVYAGDAPLPMTEDYVSLQLTTPYQATKMLGELYCNFFCHHYGLKTVRPRFFNNYGPGELPGQYRNVIPNFIYRALQGLPLRVTGTGEETRDFTYVSDTVDGLLRCGVMEAAVGQAVNIATGRETSVGSLARMINDLTENVAGIHYTDRRKWDTRSRRLGCTARARELLEFAACTPMQIGLQNTIAWFQENWEKVNGSANFASGALLGEGPNAATNIGHASAVD
ncbi:MAG TPA: NAD-dependent epimerase/dehydratase family protein [Terriglobales bacterium]|nr:NAD-dependent epimerase/dehydratase family protein [Terriglobales bacterium]